MDSSKHEPPIGYAIPHKEAWGALRQRSNYFTRSQILEMCVRSSLRVPGNIVEFGVASGASTRVIKRTLTRFGQIYFVSFGRKKIFALDSFEGLREQFEQAQVGEFKGEVPRISGVEFVKGYFEDTCTPALQRRIGKVAFAHLDADLYSSTRFALTWLTPMLSTGSLLLFDEFMGGEFAENRAFDEWRAECGVEVIRVAEFDREPSGYGSVPDRRVLFQVVKQEAMPLRNDKGRAMWKVAYYLGRLGFQEWQDRIENRMS